MPNNYFKFKRFTIFQDNVSMKVSSDAVLFGAYIQPGMFNSILDIGTGTGILSIMMAQKFEGSQIDAIEIDEKACETAIKNIKQCPWPGQIALHHSSWQAFWPDCEKKYDLIISNPPFFGNSLLPASNEKIRARHQVSLPFEGLMKGSQKLLSGNGKTCFITPASEVNRLKSAGMQYDLHCNHILNIKSKSATQANRAITTFERHKKKLQTNHLSIRNEDGAYSREYIEITSEFYLYF